MSTVCEDGPSGITQSKLATYYWELLQDLNPKDATQPLLVE
jgi:hypothetical protein